MNVKSFRAHKTKSVSLCLLIACGGLGSAVFASTPTSNGNKGAGAAAAAQTHSSSAGDELDYYHAYRASKTFAIRFKNGSSASFDLEHGTATIDDGATRTTVPLEDVLLQANNGNVQAAAAMYDEMYNSISAAHSDAIMASVGPGGYGAHGFPRWNDEIGLNNPLWGSPTGGSCWPVPFPCQQWSGGLSNWGAYNSWWGSAFGEPSPTPQPPNPAGCDPHDIGCEVHEVKRQIACDDLGFDNAVAYATTAVAGATCGAVGNLGAPGRLACLGTGLTAVIAVHKLNRDTKTCRTPRN